MKEQAYSLTRLFVFSEPREQVYVDLEKNEDSIIRIVGKIILFR